MNGLAPVPPWDGAGESLAAMPCAAHARVMNRGPFLAAFLVLALGSGGPALAQGISIPEPTDLTLLALSVAGLIVGRRAARKRPDSQD